jgi:hypothetical protein
MIQLPLLGLYSKESKSTYKRDTCSPMSIAAPFTIAKLWNQPRCPITDKERGIYTQGSNIES